MKDVIGMTYDNGYGGIITIIEKCDKKINNRYYYKVTCSICNRDTELYGDHFLICRDSINKRTPCACSGRHTVTKEQYYIKVDRYCKENNFTFVGFSDGEFYHKKTKVFCICNKCGFEYNNRDVSSFIRTGSCPECRKTLQRDRLSLKEPEVLANKICDNSKYSFVEFVGGYKNMFTKIKLMCPEHGEFSLVFNDFYRRNNGCSKCAISGFDKSKKSIFYVVIWSNETYSFIKYGVSNRTIHERIRQQGYKTDFKPSKILLCKSFDDGIIPIYIESCLKEKYRGLGVVEKEIFGDGYTETIDILLVDELLSYIDNLIRN